MKRAIKHFYKINIHTERGKALSEFMRQCADADRQADDWAKHHRAAEYIQPQHAFAGGILAVLFTTYKPDTAVWRPIETDEGDTFYMPNVPDDFDVQATRQRLANGETLTAAELLELSRYELPVMSPGHFFDVLPYQETDTIQRVRLTTSPMIFQRGTSWYVASPVPLKVNGDVDSVSEKTFYRNRMSKVNEHS